MLFKNYQEFASNFKIDENVQQAKIWMKKRALADKREKTKRMMQLYLQRRLEKSKPIQNLLR